VQFPAVFTQVRHGESQPTHCPFFMTRPVGQVLTQVPLWRAEVGEQAVQFVGVREQVEQITAQGSQVRVGKLGMVVLGGQVVMQRRDYNDMKKGETQLRQEFFVVHVEHGDSHGKHVGVICVVSGYSEVGQVFRQVLEGVVMLRYGKVAMQLVQFETVPLQVRQGEEQVRHWKFVVSVRRPRLDGQEDRQLKLVG
jgi:hypothetical protein